MSPSNYVNTYTFQCVTPCQPFQILSLYISYYDMGLWQDRFSGRVWVILVLRQIFTQNWSRKLFSPYELFSLILVPCMSMDMIWGVCKNCVGFVGVKYGCYGLNWNTFLYYAMCAILHVARPVIHTHINFVHLHGKREEVFSVNPVDTQWTACITEN